MYCNYEELPMFLSVELLAKVLDVGLSTAYGYVRSGEIEAVKVGKQYRIPKESLRNLLPSSNAG